MKFAKIVFIAAGILGIVQLLPLYFLFDEVGQRTPPAMNHPEFYFGFTGLALVWQFVFLLIGMDPSRYRPVMLLAVLEKASFVLGLAVLLAEHRIGPLTASAGASDFILGLLFVAAYAKTKPDAQPPFQ